MTASQLLDWLSSHWSAAWPVVSALLLLVLRSRTPEQWVALGETRPRVQGVVRLLRAVGLDPAKAVSALVQIVTARVPERAAPAITPPSPSKVAPVDHSGERGMVRVGTLVALSGALLLAVAVGTVLAGCPRPRDCTPATQRCEAGTPVVCSAEGRSWRVSGDPRVTCAQVGGVCIVRDGRAFCGRADAGAPIPSNPFVDGGVQ